MRWLLKGGFYFVLVQYLFMPPIFIIALIALDLVRLRGQGRVAV